MKAKSESQQPFDSLWAFYEGQFHAIPIPEENPKFDHITWFREIGLPDYGRAFDRVLRGRLIWDWQYERFTLSFYGTTHLPNRVYELVIKQCNPHGYQVIEKPVSEAWL